MFLSEEMNERGNTWLYDRENDRQYYLGRLEGNRWLEITIVPANYPGFVIHTITGTEEDLAAHINDKWAGALIRKCNIAGVYIDKDCVAEHPKV